MSDLHVYYDGDSDWVIAESPEEALNVWREATDISKEDSKDIIFVQEPDEKKMPVAFEDDMDLKDMTDDEANEWLDQDKNNGWKRLTKTCKEWTESFGKGFFCSKEY
jgi:hypothetical protein